MMKTNINLLDLDNDILNIIGEYVIEDNIKNECLKQWIEIYTKKKIIKDLDKEIAILKHKDETGELLGNLIHDKLNKKIFSFDEILDFWLDRDLMVKCIEKDKKYKCIFTSDELKNNNNEDDEEEKEQLYINSLP